MAGQAQPAAMGCPGCVASPASVATVPPGSVSMMFSLPGIHCQGCISKVEAALNAVPGVRSARVNLTRKQVAVDTVGELHPDLLAGVLREAGFDALELDPDILNETQTNAAGRDLLLRMAVAGFGAMNVMLLSVAVWSGAADATRDLFHWISAAITLPALAFSAQPFFRNAWTALRAGRLNMDVPITLAIVLAVATSLWETALSGKHAYFDAALALTFFLLAGRWLEARARAAARSAAEELTALEVPRALRIENGVPVERPAAELAPGDHVLVKPGARAPVDGLIRSGTSEVDRSALTGETVPVAMSPGQTISAGEVNLTGPLTLEATAVGRDTSLHRLAELVAVAESGRSRYTPLADKAAKLYAPGVHILAALAFLGWLAWAGDLRVAANIAAAVLIITCPCALGLAVPAVTTAASGRLFARGLLIKDATALERLAHVDTVVFDKTGTLTEGTPRSVNFVTLTVQQKRVAKALARHSEHPLARAVVSAADADSVPDMSLSDIEELPGRGVRAMMDGVPVCLGRPGWLDCEPQADGLVSALRIGDAPAVELTFEDNLRQGAGALVRALKERDMSIVLLSGDRAQPVANVAAALGIDEAHADMLPDGKIRFVEALRDSGSYVLMIGDGLNDTGALTAAHVSVSPAQALDAARAASDIVLLGGDLSPVAEAVDTARKASRRISENFRIATLYNIVAVPLAVAGLATPLIAALAMSLSSVTVSLNALRLGGGSK